MALLVRLGVSTERMITNKMEEKRVRSSGVSLIELIVVIAIIGTMARLVTLDLFRGQQRVSLTAARDAVIRDIRDQQLRAMSGDTTTPGVYVDYSIRFEPTRYVLFPGSVYVSDNPQNTTVLLDGILRFTSVVFPSATVTFARLSGDIRNFAAGNDSVTLTNTQTSEQFRIQLNIHGIPFTY